MPEVCGIEARSTLDKLREWIVGMLIAVGGQTDECFDLADYRQPRPYRMAVDTPPAFCRKRANGGPNVPILKEAKPEYAKTAMRFCTWEIKPWSSLMWESRPMAACASSVDR